MPIEMRNCLEMRTCAACCNNGGAAGGHEEGALMRVALFFCLCLGLSLVFLPRPAAALSEADLLDSARLTAGELAAMTRLRAAGFSDRPRLYIRLFKLEKMLEVWVKKGDGYKLHQSFDICRYSGKLGPKIEEGDGQAPEGFYHIPVEEIFWRSAKWPKALNLAFPNVLDAQSGHTGSFLLIHGGCSSKGCYALEDGPMAQLFDLVRLAARGGQEVFPVHIFPFRFDKDNWKRHKKHRWAGYWADMKPVYDYFASSLKLPEIVVCPEGYETLAYRQMKDDGRGVRGSCVVPLPLSSLSEKTVAALDWTAALKQRYSKLLQKRGAGRALSGGDKGLKFKISCNLKRPSCRKWVALKKKRLAREQQRNGGR